MDGFPDTLPGTRIAGKKQINCIFFYSALGPRQQVFPCPPPFLSGILNGNIREWGNCVFPDLGPGQTNLARLFRRGEIAGAVKLDLMSQGGSGGSEGQVAGRQALQGSRVQWN